MVVQSSEPPEGTQDGRLRGGQPCELFVQPAEPFVQARVIGVRQRGIRNGQPVFAQPAREPGLPVLWARPLEPVQDQERHVTAAGRLPAGRAIGEDAIWIPDIVGQPFVGMRSKSTVELMGAVSQSVRRALCTAAKERSGKLGGGNDDTALDSFRKREATAATGDSSR